MRGEGFGSENVSCLCLCGFGARSAVYAVSLHRCACREWSHFGCVLNGAAYAAIRFMPYLSYHKAPSWQGDAALSYKHIARLTYLDVHDARSDVPGCQILNVQELHVTLESEDQRRM
eukprot:scaffold44662_cov28-Tisochrysis_lutea.AAC.4